MPEGKKMPMFVAIGICFLAYLYPPNETVCQGIIHVGWMYIIVKPNAILISFIYVHPSIQKSDTLRTIDSTYQFGLFS